MSKPAFASDAPRRVLAVGLALFAIISRADTQPSSCLSAIEGLKSCSRTDGPCNAEAVVDALSPRPRQMQQLSVAAEHWLGPAEISTWWAQRLLWWWLLCILRRVAP